MDSTILPAIGAGIVQGTALALVAVGFTLIYRATKVLNFANGQQMLLGGYVLWFLDAKFGLPFLAAAPLAVAVGFLVGVAMDRLVIGPLRQASLFMQVIALLAVARLLDGFYLQFFGPDSKHLPAYVSAEGFIPGLSWSEMDLAILLVSALSIGLLVVILYRTRLGDEMRATADNALAASLVGVNPTVVGIAAWGIGGALATLSGVMLLPKFLLGGSIAFTVTFNAFAAVTIGGVGSLAGAVVGGLVIGVADALVGNLIAAGYEPLVSLAIMILVFTIRPTGIVGERA